MTNTSFVRRFHRTFYTVPLALFLLDFLLTLSFAALREQRLGTLSVYALTAGIVSGWVSFATGMIGVFQLRKNTMAAGLAAIHGFVSGLALMIFNLLWFAPWHALPAVARPTPATLLLKGLGLLLFSVGIYLARKYVRRHAAAVAGEH